MALMPCVYCHRVPKARLYSLIWAWQGQDGRVAVKTRSCAADLGPAVEAMGEAMPEEGDYVQLPLSCPSCSDPLESGDHVLTWLTYWDGEGEHRPNYAHCSACADRFHYALREAGELMADRPLQNRRRAA
jgi:hypothetical protein